MGFDGGVHDLACFEVVLKMEAVLGKHLGNEVGKNLFADVAPEFGGLEIVLEIFHGAADLAEGAGFFLEVTNDGGSLIETGEELAVVLLKRGVGGTVRRVERLLEGLEPSVESRIGFLSFELLFEKKVN